jgi:plastocyanin
VKWINRDGEPHTVTSQGAAKLLKSSPLDTDDSFAFTFDDAGTYKYFCTLHPHMQGTVVVE